METISLPNKLDSLIALVEKLNTYSDRLACMGELSFTQRAWVTDDGEIKSSSVMSYQVRDGNNDTVFRVVMKKKESMEAFLHRLNIEFLKFYTQIFSEEE